MADWSYGSPLVATARGISVAMALRQKEIGRIIGMSRETVSRALADLRQQHIAEIHDSTLLVDDMPALQGSIPKEQAADGCQQPVYGRLQRPLPMVTTFLRLAKQTLPS